MKPRKIKANLMIDEGYITEICRFAQLKDTDRVLEIGAGTGNLTTELVKMSGYVYAIEKDPAYCSILKERFSHADNIKIISGDALKLDFPEIDKIVSNLPYEISRKITEKILGHRFDSAVLVYQKEFAEKLIAKPGEKNYRPISVLAQSATQIEVLDTIPPEAFSPRPKVHSAIVRLKQKKKLDKGYMDFVKKLFSQRNKLVGSLIKDAPIGLREKRVSQLDYWEFEALT